MYSLFLNSIGMGSGWIVINIQVKISTAVKEKKKDGT